MRRAATTSSVEMPEADDLEEGQLNQDSGASCFWQEQNGAGFASQRFFFS